MTERDLGARGPHARGRLGAARREHTGWDGALGRGAHTRSLSLSRLGRFAIVEAEIEGRFAALAARRLGFAARSADGVLRVAARAAARAVFAFTGAVRQRR